MRNGTFIVFVLLHDRVLKVIVRSASMHAYVRVAGDVPQRPTHGISLFISSSIHLCGVNIKPREKRNATLMLPGHQPHPPLKNNQ